MQIHGREFLPSTALGIGAFHALAACAVWQLVFARTHFTKTAWLIVIALYIVRILGITVAYHRLLAHGSYTPKPWFAKIMLACAAVSLQGLGTWWKRVHKQHHAFADVLGDPHRPTEFEGLKGFMWSHVGWILFTVKSPSGYVEPETPEDISALLNWQKRWYFLFALAGILLPLLAGWNGFLLGSLGLVLSWHITWSVNSVGHVFGDHAKDQHGKLLESRRARNFPLWCLFNILALLSGGELWHANHHAFPGSARLGWGNWQFDPGWRTIWVANKMGWVKNIKRPDRIAKSPSLLS
jgi:stearoyl-CoA desaturase (delta-9 desaturase)